jgi:hypothetical protein
MFSFRYSSWGFAFKPRTNISKPQALTTIVHHLVGTSLETFSSSVCPLKLMVESHSIKILWERVQMHFYTYLLMYTLYT